MKKPHHRMKLKHLKKKLNQQKKIALSSKQQIMKKPH